MKDFLIILFLFSMFDALEKNKLFASNKTGGPVVKATREVNNALLDIHFSSGENILKNLQEMWKNEPKFQEFKSNLAANYRECALKAQAENWTKSTWRSDRNIKCGKSTLNPDEFRRFVIKQFEEMTTNILVRTKMIRPDSSEPPLKWLAIGTLSPDSDIDTVANNHGNNQNQYLPKIVAEVRAKSLFDALGLAMFGRPTGYNFDTESYIDVTTDLKKSEYEERIKNSNYQNLAFTLAFAQIVRQLHHEIKLSGSKIYSYDDFKKSLEDSSLRSLLEDAYKFSGKTEPDDDQTENIKKYLPIINHLAQKIASTSTPEEISKLKGILGAYFPESYYTREALAHVCYSDDRYSQVLLQMIDTHLKDVKNNNKISAENIDEFKQKTITPNKFIYAVSALENLGYFFHKLDGKSTPYEALKNASKYFFRIARALAGYWGVVFHYDTFEQSKETSDAQHNERLYVKSLFEIASKLERLKRGFLPFSSPKEAEKIFANVNQAFPTKEPLSPIKVKAKELENHLLAKQIYGLHIDLIATKAEKIQTLKRLAEKYKSVVIWKNETKSFEIIESISHIEEKTAALGFASLLNLIIGAETKIETKHEIEKSLSQEMTLPFWESKIPPEKISNENFLKFLNELTLFIKHTLEDYKKIHEGFEYRATNLADDTEKEIAAANPHGKGLLKTHGHSK